MLDVVSNINKGGYEQMSSKINDTLSFELIDASFQYFGKNRMCLFLIYSEVLATLCFDNTESDDYKLWEDNILQLYRYYEQIPSEAYLFRR